VTPEHEHALVIVEHDGDGCSWHTNHVVLEAFPIGKFDIGQSKLDPSALVERALSMYPPAHAFVLDHDPIIADDLRYAAVAPATSCAVEATQRAGHGRPVGLLMQRTGEGAPRTIHMCVTPSRVG
jgi:hypothetical protein